jgi:cation diffusion facilitator family transporter
MSHHNIAIRTVFFSIVSNTILAIIKYLSGTYGHSYALIADSMESLIDIVSSSLLLIAMRYASKKPNREYPYGYGKAESLMTIVSIFFIFMCGVTIFMQGLQNIFTHHQSPEPFTLYVLGIIIAWKEGCFQYVYYRANKIQSTALRAEAWHHRSDAFTSIAAFIGIAIAIWMGPGYEHADDWAALVAACAIFYNVYTLISPAFHEILDGNMYQDVIDNLCQIALSVEGVLKTEKCYIRKSGMTYHAELHIQVSPELTVFEGHNIAHAVKRKALEELPQLKTLVTHIEPVQ